MTSKYEVLNNGQWIVQSPVEGDQVRFYPDIDTLPDHFIEYIYQDISEPEINNYFTLSDNLSSEGQPLVGLNHVYYVNMSQEIVLTCDIVDSSGNIQTQIDAVGLNYPPVLKMPCVKFAGGINGVIVDEVYFNVTLVNGVLTATGILPSSGDWKLLENRLNQSLKSIGADWRITRPNVTFLA